MALGSAILSVIRLPSANLSLITEFSFSASASLPESSLFNFDCFYKLESIKLSALYFE